MASKLVNQRFEFWKFRWTARRTVDTTYSNTPVVKSDSDDRRLNTVDAKSADVMISDCLFDNNCSSASCCTAGMVSKVYGVISDFRNVYIAAEMRLRYQSDVDVVEM